MTRIESNRVDLAVESESGSENVSLENDTVYVLAGGEAPVALLTQCGISFGGSGTPSVSLAAVESV